MIKTKFISVIFLNSPPYKLWQYADNQLYNQSSKVGCTFSFIARENRNFESL